MAMALLQVRGRKQAAVTVLLSSIERFIVAEDDDKVQTQQTVSNRFASESDPLNLLSCSNFQPKTS